MQKFRKVCNFLADLRTGCRHYDVGLLKGVTSSLNLYCFERFSLREIIGYGFFVPEIRKTLPVLISKEASLAKLEKLNPSELQSRTEDKAVFYDLCRQHNLPTPVSYGLFNNGSGTDDAGDLLEGRAAWAAYFQARLPAHFIVKDMAGAYGSGFAAFERSGDDFLEVGRDRYDAAGLYDRLCRSSPSHLVVQERLFDHPDLQSLCGQVGLQTIKVNTILNPDGSVELLFYVLKVLSGDNVTDNFWMGQSGNLIAYGKPDEGVLEAARSLHPSGCGLIDVHEHPETQVPFAGYRIPLWAEGIALAKSAHLVFPEFGTLGWDVALTAEGPKLLETNARWDPPLYAPHIMSDSHWRQIFE